MDLSDHQDLLDRRAVLLETLDAGVSDEDRPFLYDELAEVWDGLAALRDKSTTDQ